MILGNTYICSVCGKTCMGAGTCGKNGDYKECGYCPFCHNEMLDTGIDFSDYVTLVSNDPNYDKLLINTIVKPHGKFNSSEEDRSNIKIQKNIAQSNRNAQLFGTDGNLPKCPTCQSTNIRKMSGLETGTSVAVFGLFSRKINKTFKCNKCGYTW